MVFALDVPVPAELDWRGAKWPRFVGDYRYANSRGHDNVLHFSELDWLIDPLTYDWENEIITRLDAQRACDFQTGKWMRYRTYTAEEELARKDPWAWVKKHPVKAYAALPPLPKPTPPPRHKWSPVQPVIEQSVYPQPLVYRLPPTPPAAVLSEAEQYRRDTLALYTATNGTDIFVCCLACHARGISNDYATFYRAGFGKHWHSTHGQPPPARPLIAKYPITVFEYAVTSQYIYCVKCGLFFQTHGGLNNHWMQKHVPGARFADDYDYRPIVACYQDRLEEPL